MNNIIINLIFSFFSAYTLIKLISYGLYEINEEENKFGGILLIVFSFASLIFGNIMFWIN